MRRPQEQALKGAESQELLTRWAAGLESASGTSTQVAAKLAAMAAAAARNSARTSATKGVSPGAVRAGVARLRQPSANAAT